MERGLSYTKRLIGLQINHSSENQELTQDVRPKAVAARLRRATRKVARLLAAVPPDMIDPEAWALLAGLLPPTSQAPTTPRRTDR